MEEERVNPFDNMMAKRIGERLRSAMSRKGKPFTGEHRSDPPKNTAEAIGQALRARNKLIDPTRVGSGPSRVRARLQHGDAKQARRVKNVGYDPDWSRVCGGEQRGYQAGPQAEIVVQAQRKEQSGSQPQLVAADQGGLDGGETGIGSEVQGPQKKDRKARQSKKPSSRRRSNRAKEVR